MYVYMLIVILILRFYITTNTILVVILGIKSIIEIKLILLFLFITYYKFNNSINHILVIYIS